MSNRPAQITDSHLARRAIAYLRQSTPDQVRENTGSTSLQRDLPDLLQAWGWPPDRIQVVDQDLGVSGATPGFRRGFTYLIEEMRAGMVGMVAVTEISRLGRNTRDFALFAELAQQNRVLLAHGGQILDFNDPNSAFIAVILGANATRENQARVVLAMKARRKKAENGVAMTVPPKGYISAPNGVWVKDPDPRVQDVVALVFDHFLRSHSAGAVVRAFRRNDLKLPGKFVHGVRTWVPATRFQIYYILKHPAYRGAYVYGRRQSTGPVDARGHKGELPRPMSEWVCVENHHEPYVSPETWAQIQERFRESRSPLKAPLGQGEALVQGILRCTVHNRAFRVWYNGRLRLPDGTIKRLPKYWCQESSITGSINSCGRISAKVVDNLVERELLKVLAPPSMDTIQDATRQTLREYRALERARADELRRCEQSIDDAQRAFDQTESTQPLLRKRFAQRLETHLQRLEEVRASHRLHPIYPPLGPEEAEVEELRRLLQDLPALWRHASVAPEQRKTILRTAIRRLHATPGPEFWHLEIEWVGGERTPLLMQTFRHAGLEIDQALNDGLTNAQILDRFRTAGFIQRRGKAAGMPYTDSALKNLIKLRRHFWRKRNV